MVEYLSPKESILLSVIKYFDTFRQSYSLTFEVALNFSKEKKFTSDLFKLKEKNGYFTLIFKA